MKKAIIFNLGGTLVDVREDNRGLHPHVTELLPILYGLGHNMAVTIPEDLKLMEHLDTRGIRQYFMTVVTPHHLSSGRPYAESVSVALKHLQAEPQHAVLVGDTVGMIIAAKQAGVAKVIGVSYGKADPSALSAAGADYIVTDIPAILDVLE